MKAELIRLRAELEELKEENEDIKEENNLLKKKNMRLSKQRVASECEDEQEGDPKPQVQRSSTIGWNMIV